MSGVRQGGEDGLRERKAREQDGQTNGGAPLESLEDKKKDEKTYGRTPDGSGESYSWHLRSGQRRAPIPLVQLLEASSGHTKTLIHA